MKKVFTLLMVLLLGLGLVACKNNEGDEDEAKAPVLNGLKQLKLWLVKHLIKSRSNSN